MYHLSYNCTQVLLRLVDMTMHAASFLTCCIVALRQINRLSNTCCKRTIYSMSFCWYAVEKYAISSVNVMHCNSIYTDATNPLTSLSAL